jgi:hypothetical protein
MVLCSEFDLSRPAATAWGIYLNCSSVFAMFFGGCINAMTAFIITHPMLRYALFI